MRNLKRALSLALACVMLLGMMITGAGAASTSFTDFDQIVNQEAAEVTSGLKIFEGYTDGSFGPDRPVTRAEMAVIICKLLNGASVDPTNFTGLTKFTDVPSWAEGYVNYCNSMGIVVGVGDSKFDPNRTVSTVEAATMLLKALGYFIEEDQLGADWKTVVTGRATSLHLYGDLTLAVDEPLTRDNVAELVFHTLFAQRVAYDDNRHLYVKNTDRDVVVTNGTEDKYNTFAMNTFDMWYIDGVVLANSYTRDSLSETVNNAPRTDVLFDTPADYMGSAATHYAFEYTTGLDMIGHAARVYYSIDRNAPVVYAIADRATKVDQITYNANTTNRANAANEAGFRRNSILDIENYWVNYDYERYYPSNDARLTPTDPNNVVNTTQGAEPNLTLILISNSSDYKVDCVIVLDQYLDTVKRVTERNDETNYDLTSANGSRQNVALEDAAQDDYVIVTNIGMQGEMLVFEKPELQTASITKITGTSNPGVTKTITADGTEYKGSPVFHHRTKTSANNLSNTTNFEQINAVGEVTLILDSAGKCIGIAEAPEPDMYAYVAQYAYQNGATVGFNSEGKLLVKAYLSDGTSGVYTVNTTSNRNSNAFYNFKFSGDVDADLAKLNVDGGKPHYKVYNADDMDGSFVNSATNNLKTTTTVPGFTGVAGTADQNGIGVFKASVRTDGSIVLEMLGGDNADRANAAEARTVKGHSTLVVSATLANMATALTLAEAAVHMDPNGYVTDGAVTGTLPYGATLYQTSDTVYFYVTGEYDGTGDDALNVSVRTGVKNAESFYASSSVVAHNKDNKYGNDQFLQLFTKTPSASTPGRRNVTAALVHGLRVEGDTNLYFYKQGSWHETPVGTSSRASDKLVDVTFELYNMDGELVEHTYTNEGKHFETSEVNDFVRDIPTGWYKIGSKELEEFSASANSTLEEDTASGRRYRHSDGYVFIVDAVAEHDDYQTNIFTNVDPVGGIAENAVVVDLTGEDMFHDIASIAQADANGDTVKISYCYKTGSTDPYLAKAVFVTSYSPKGTGGVADSTLRVAYVQGRGMVYYPSATAVLNAIAESTATPAQIRALGEAVKTAYETAGFRVYVATYNDGTGYYAMMITPESSSTGMWMLPQYVTNNPAGTTANGTTYYPDRVLVNNAGNEIAVGGEINPEDPESIVVVPEGSVADGQNLTIEMASRGTLYVGRDVTLRIYDENYVAPGGGRAGEEEGEPEVGFTLDAAKTYNVTINGLTVTGVTKTDADDNVYVEVTFTLRSSDVLAGVLSVTKVEEKVSGGGPVVANPDPVSSIVITLAAPAPAPAPGGEEGGEEGGEGGGGEGGSRAGEEEVAAYEFVIGQRLPVPSATSEQFEIVRYSWKLNEKSVANDSEIVAGRYQLSVQVAAKEGYTLTNVTKASLSTLTVNGETAGVGYDNAIVTYAKTVAAGGGGGEDEETTYTITLENGIAAYTDADGSTEATLTDLAANSKIYLDFTAVSNYYVKVGTDYKTSSDERFEYTVTQTETIGADKYYKVTMDAQPYTGATLPTGLTLDITVPANSYVTGGGSVNVSLSGSGTCTTAPTSAVTLVLSTPEATNSTNYKNAVEVVAANATQFDTTAFKTTDTVTIAAPVDSAEVQIQYTLAGGQ